jgi:hypothetical protein
VQAEAPLLALYEPTGHEVQANAPVWAENQPEGHGAQIASA